MYLQDVHKHPVVKRVEQWSDPLGASVEAKRELKNSVIHKSDGIFITDNYLIRKRFFTFNIFPFSDLLWVYKKVTRHYANFIPTGKSYGAILVFYGGGEAFGGKERRVDELLAFAANKAPWAIVGFSSEIKEIFEKRTSEFCQAVEARRQELSQKG